MAQSACPGIKNGKKNLRGVGTKKKKRKKTLPTTHVGFSKTITKHGPDEGGERGKTVKKTVSPL